MSQCQRCKSERVALLNAKCSDCCQLVAEGKELFGYVADDAGIGGGDYVEFYYCLDCGQIQGKFPVHINFKQST